jgi:hypothetical protein
MRFRFPVLLLAMGLALAACLSEEPIGKPDPATNDSRVLGKWRSEDTSFPPFDNGQSVWLVEAVDDGTLSILRQNRKGETRAGSRPAIAHVTQLPSGAYLNLKTDGREYLIARYTFDGPDRLSLQFLDGAAVAKAINEKTLPGVLKQEGAKMTVPYVTASSAQWQEFLAVERPGLFGKAQVFVRPDPVTTAE